VECDDFFVTNFIIFVLSKFRTKLLAANHLIKWDRTKFDTEEKSSKFLLEIMTLVSSANMVLIQNLFSGIIYIYICIMNSTGPRIDPWGIPHFNVFQSDKKFWVELGAVTSTF